MKTKNNLQKILSASLFALLFSAIGCQNAEAIEYESLGGRPAYPDSSIENSSSWFIYNLNPGETKEDAVLVVNNFEKGQKVLIYAADGQVGSSGGFALRQFADPQEKVGQWIKFYPDNPPEFFQDIFEKKEGKIIPFCQISREDLQTEMKDLEMIGEEDELSDEQFNALEEWCRGIKSLEKDLEAQERIIIPFTFSVPNDADVGEHTGGILIQKVASEESNMEGSVVKLTIRMGVRIYQTVPGEIIRKITLENFNVKKNFKEFDPSRFFCAYWFGKGNPKLEEYIVQSKIKNEGNASIEHEDTIQVRDLLFKKRNEDVSREFQVLRDSSFTSNYTWNNPRFGWFSFSKAVKYKDATGVEQAIQTDEIRIWIIPWREIVFALVVLAIMMTSYILWKRRQKKIYGGIGWVEYEVKGEDDINKLAEKYGSHWKVLAKTNKLKAPYLLEAGQTILVPPAQDSETEIEKEQNQKQTKWKFFRNKKIILSAIGLLIILAIGIATVFFIMSQQKKAVEIKEEISIPSLGASQ